MSEIERLTITLPAQMAADVKDAVSGGEYASTSEVIREALRDWKLKRTTQREALAALRSDIDKGLADLAACRMTDFDAEKIMREGRKRLARRATSG